MSDYVGENTLVGTHWDEERWHLRKEQLADVWTGRDEEGRKEIIALLVAHAPEATCQNTNRKI